MTRKNAKGGKEHEHGTDDGGGDIDDSALGAVFPGDLEGDETGSSGGFDILSATDAGEGEEAQAAEKVKALKIIARANNENGEALALAAIRGRLYSLIDRAKAIQDQQLNRFPDLTAKMVGGERVFIVNDSDENRWAAFEWLYGMEEERPFSNDFTGYRTDRDGVQIDKRYPAVELVKALGIIGLRGQKAETIRKCLADWADEHHRNPIVERVLGELPEWDGVGRLDTSMVDLFECFDTPLNRRMGWYFWTSLFVRVVHGGNNAGIVLSLFGAQNCGKSYFTKRIVSELMGDDAALPTSLDLAGGAVNFLRMITGNSVIANVPEMTGFTRGDLNKIKSFITNTSDTFDFKFEGALTKQRQWIVVMDGNQYEGLQRDSTGNRRFYPVFCGQIDSEESNDGKTNWKDAPFQCPMIVEQGRAFEEYMWNCLAESAAWIDKHGLSAYNSEVGRLANEVQKFSLSEMDRGRGVVEDAQLETYGYLAMRMAKKSVFHGRGDQRGVTGIQIDRHELHMRLSALSKGREPIPKHVTSFIKSLGGEVVRSNCHDVFRFFGWKSVEDFDDVKTGIWSRAASSKSDDGFEIATDDDAGAERDIGSGGGF